MPGVTFELHLALMCSPTTEPFLEIAWPLHIWGAASESGLSSVPFTLQDLAAQFCDLRALCKEFRAQTANKVRSSTWKHQEELCS